MSPPTKIAQTKEKRTHYRVSPPSFLVKEFALWFMPPFDKLTLPLEYLGVPFSCNINASGDTRLDDVSGGGMRFSFPKTNRCMIDALKARHCYIFLKLRRPTPGKFSPHCLFLGMELIQATAREDRIQVRGKIVSRGIPAQASKQFQLFNVARVGVRELSVWCEEIDRMGRGIVPPATAGIDLEYLLLELSYMTKPSAEQTCAASQDVPSGISPITSQVTSTVTPPTAPTDPPSAPFNSATPRNTVQSEVERLMQSSGINPFATKSA